MRYKIGDRFITDTKNVYTVHHVTYGSVMLWGVKENGEEWHAGNYTTNHMDSMVFRNVLMPIGKSIEPIKFVKKLKIW